MSSTISLNASTIGSAAQEVLHSQAEGTVNGITSRGIFVLTNSKRIIFLTADPYKGPLTVNLDWCLPAIKEITPGSEVFFEKGTIRIPQASLQVELTHVRVWRPEPPTAAKLTQQERLSRLNQFAVQISSCNNREGLGWMLPYLLPPGGSTPETVMGEKWRQLVDALELRQNLANDNISHAADCIERFVGKGPGLTPSGDDFITGILLMLNRWKEPNLGPESLENLNSHTIQAAYRKTTTLSANLIQCAAAGLADERLVAALDWIMGNGVLEDPPVRGLLGWGHSSGIDVFTGFAAALSFKNKLLI